jgi:heme-degrading monooxygenase HmoA
MPAVITIVSGDVAPERRAELVAAYEAATAGELPPAIEMTFLAGDTDAVSVVTVWRSREQLDAFLGSGEEPLARRLIREAGATPSVRILEVLARA